MRTGSNKLDVSWLAQGGGAWQEHPDLLMGRFYLAYLLHLQQRLSEAGTLCRRALMGCEKTLEHHHPTVQACKSKCEGLLPRK